MIKICVKTCDMNSTLGSVVPLAMFFVVNPVFQDGTIDKNDLRGAFDNVGVLMTESELDELLGEVRKNNIHILLRQHFSRCQGLAPMTTWSSSSKTKWLGVSSYSILQVAPHTNLGTNL